ncbi:MAG: peptide ABC transporter substrate-binding protein [Pseudomonadota bacterium]
MLQISLLLALMGAPLATFSQQGKVLHIGNPGEPETLDPHKYNLRLEETLLNDLFMGLTTFNAQGDIVPGAAERWETSEDGLQWTFYLNPDLTWSDGTALTANDFEYAFRRLLNPETAASLAYFMYMIKNAVQVNSGELPVNALGVTAVDATTLKIELDRPYPYFLERLLYPTGFPVPQHAIDKHGADWIKAENWVSNGAYVLKEWRPQSHIALKKNANFIEPAAINEVHYHPVASEQSAYNRFRSNDLDVIATFPVGQIETVAKNTPAALRRSDLLSMMYLVFNTQTPPLNDVRVRQALSLAIHQPTLTDKVLRSGARPAYSFAPDLISAYTPVNLPHANTTMPQRIAQAKALLNEAGYGARNPLELTLRHVNNSEGKKLNLAITGLWRRIGVRAVLEQGDIRNHFGSLRQGDFEAAWAGWVGENNAEHYLTLLQSDVGSVNYGRFSNADYDAKIAEAQSEADFHRRNALLAEAEAIAIHHYAVVPLYTSAVRRLVSPQLQGWHENPRDMHQSRYLSWK